MLLGHWRDVAVASLTCILQIFINILKISLSGTEKHSWKGINPLKRRWPNGWLLHSVDGSLEVPGGCCQHQQWGQCLFGTCQRLGVARVGPALVPPGVATGTVGSGVGPSPPAPELGLASNSTSPGL